MEKKENYNMTNKEIFENPEHRDNIKEHLKATETTRLVWLT